jgi:plastocyanin
MEELLRERSLTRYEMHLHGSNEPVEPYRPSETAVVYLEAVPAPAGGYDPPAAHPQLNQSQMLFRPLVLPVLVGSTVDFPNNDNLFHNVFSYSQPREFDLGRYPRGQLRSVRFDRTGVVNVYCDIHSYMYATILVLENPYYAVPDEDGSYTIENVPAGSYKLVFWYGRKKVSAKSVTVEEKKTTVVNLGF